MSKQTEKEKIKALEVKINELDAQLKRAVADYCNLEKRVTEGRSELTKWGTSELLVKILPVLDHLEQVINGGRSVLSEPSAVSSVEPRSESNGWFKGVEMAVKELQTVLQSEGLEQIVAEGQFNPHLQEAVDTEPGDDNIILKVVKKGYTLNGKVLRPAAVVVGRKLESSNMNQESREEEKGKMA